MKEILNDILPSKRGVANVVKECVSATEKQIIDIHSFKRHM
jgi:hypothetical protein